MINDRRLLKLTGDLVRIDSQNPPGNEEAIAAYVAGYVRRLGLRTKVIALSPHRQNVLAWLEGSNSKTLLITPHLDTVPAGSGWKHHPFAAVTRNGRMFGLGTTDCKGNLAVAMETLRSLVEDKVRLSYTLLFAATADEESGSAWGLVPLLEKKALRPDAAVVLDADDFEIIVEQKGLMHLKVRILGKKAHGAYPWLGVNAIDQAAAVLADLRARSFPGARHLRSRLLRGPTVNVGTIKGGDKVNVVAGWCEFELDYRFLPGMSEKKLLAGLRSVLRRHSRHFRIQVDGIQKPYRIASGHPLVRQLSSAMRSCGIKPRIRGSEGATVITFFQHQGIPAIATGFGAEGCAHIVDEYVPVDNLCRGARCLQRFLTDFRFT